MVRALPPKPAALWEYLRPLGRVFLEAGMGREELSGRLYLSTIGADSRALALRYGLGLEIAEFCTAENLDGKADEYQSVVRRQMAGLNRFWFHGPFAELSPASIDPLVRQVTLHRYRQAVQMALGLGISRLVIHSGFIPLVYFPEWFVAQSVTFWREFLTDMPEGLTIALENVMEPGPEMLVEIVRQVRDSRLGLCLDLGHANTRVSRTRPADWVEPMAPWLRHVHLHNNEGDLDLHRCLGAGTIPMENLLDTLLDRCPYVTFTIENQNCEPSVAWLAERGYLK